MTYSYFDGEFYVFMDEEYNQTMLTHDQVEDALKYIKENDVVTVKFLYGTAFSVEPKISWNSKSSKRSRASRATPPPMS